MFGALRNVTRGRAGVGRKQTTSEANQLVSPRAEHILSRARTAFAAGQLRETADLCKRALTLEFDPFGVHALLADAEFPGDNYFQLLERIHRHLCPRTYVEIGIKSGESLRFATHSKTIIGIDPEPQLVGPVPDNVRVFRETSDAFFAGHDLFAELGGQPVDLAFIDGMHLFDFAVRDFINLERYCTPSSTILVHDCYPLDERSQHRGRVTSFWSGDVWKLILCLKQYRPDLIVHTVATAPTGLAIIRGFDPTSTVLRDRIESICDEFVSLPYSVLEKDKPGQLNLVGNDWTIVRGLLEPLANPRSSA